MSASANRIKGDVEMIETVAFVRGYVRALSDTGVEMTSGQFEEVPAEWEERLAVAVKDFEALAS